MFDVSNPTGKHRPKRLRHGEGSVILRKPYVLKDGTVRKRRKPYAAVVPWVDQQGRRRETWLSATSREEADEFRKAELRKQAKGLVRSDETVGGYVSGYLRTVDVGPGTLPRYEQHLIQRVAPTLGAVPLASLTPARVRAAMTAWTGAPQTRGGTLRLLRAAMKQAVTDRLIEHDPTAGIPYPKVTRHDPVTLTAAEARHLMATVKGERFAPILVVSLGLGVRRGEALGLRTQDIKWDIVTTTRRGAEQRQGTGSPTAWPGPSTVDSDDPGFVSGLGVGSDHPRSTASAAHPVSVTIAKGLRYIPPPLRAEGEGPYRLTGTKTGETREIPLPAFVAEALRVRVAERDAEQRAAKVYAPNDFVFCDLSGNSVALETLRTWYLGALKRAGLPPARWHSLRATAVTLLLDMGVDVLTIQRIVGHRDLATTRRYVGKTPTAMAAAAERLDEAMG